jgi:hypothetical protein
MAHSSPSANSHASQGIKQWLTEENDNRKFDAEDNSKLSESQNYRK